MRYLIVILILAATLLPSSCEDFNLFVDCDKCFPYIGENYNLKIRVTINNQNQNVPITLYKGKIDDGIIISNDVAYESSYYSIQVKFGEYYSAVAKYRDKGRVIYAVDGRKLTKHYSKSDCDAACYEVTGDELDLRLK